MVYCIKCQHVTPTTAASGASHSFSPPLLAISRLCDFNFISVPHVYLISPRSLTDHGSFLQCIRARRSVRWFDMRVCAHVCAHPFWKRSSCPGQSVLSGFAAGWQAGVSSQHHYWNSVHCTLAFCSLCFSVFYVFLFLGFFPYFCRTHLQ